MFNLIIGLTGIILGIMHFFVDSIHVPIYISVFFVFVMSLLIGIEKVKNNQKREGFFYVVVALFMSVVLIDTVFFSA